MGRVPSIHGKQYDISGYVMGVEEVRELLPQAYPMLQIDRVLELEAGSHIVVLKNVSVTDPALQGHFPSRMVQPAVLTLETVGQSAALLGLRTFMDIDGVALEEIRDSYTVLTGLKECRIRSMVTPGDQLIVRTELVKRRRLKKVEHANFNYVVTANGELVMDGILQAAQTPID